MSGDADCRLRREDSQCDVALFFRSAPNWFHRRHPANRVSVTSVLRFAGTRDILATHLARSRRLL